MRHHLFNVAAELQRRAGLGILIASLLTVSCSDETAVQPSPIEDTDGSSETDDTTSVDSTPDIVEPDVDGSDSTDDADGSDNTDTPDVPDVDGSDDATDGEDSTDDIVDDVPDVVENICNTPAHRRCRIDGRK